MYGTPIIPKTFSFTRMLGGISKTLNVANQLIPLYNQAKPMISNARNILGVLRNFNEPVKQNSKIIDTNDYEIKKEVESINSNNPTFFI